MSIRGEEDEVDARPFMLCAITYGYNGLSAALVK